jgi:hypothetical protein
MFETELKKIRVGFAEPITQHQNIIIKNLFENKS